jgi:hypothetical protein
MAHPIHQLPQIGTLSGGQIVAGMPEIMEVHTGQTGPLAGCQPDAATEVAMTQRLITWAGEDERVRSGRAEVGQVTHKIILYDSRHCNLPVTRR